MASTFSNTIPLGFSAPNFKLLDTVSNSMTSLAELKSDKATLIMFICNHCPYVKHVNKQLVELANHYIPQGISFIAINSNDAYNYPEDSPEMMTKYAKILGYPFPYLYDETQIVAKAYDAVCTPDFYIFEKDMKCVYRGQLDDSRPSNGKPVNGKDIRLALEAILKGNKVNEQQIPGIGCSIKWK